jgi:RimJ/RimL family protein N-acetyltransferase
MVQLKKADRLDVKTLTTTQVRAFVDDNKNKPLGCNLSGPPGYDSPDWNLHWIENTPYYKILFDGQIVGGLILFDMGHNHFEVGRIWIDPDYQNRGIGQAAMRAMFSLHPEVRLWTLGTPSWAVRNQHFYEELGFIQVRETDIDPDLGWSGIEYELVCS